VDVQTTHYINSGELIMSKQGWRKIVDFGGGNEVWQSKTGSFIRYDCGGVSSKWRDDPISTDEAVDACASDEGFLRVIHLVQNRLVAAGADAWSGSPSPLCDPQ
jgi:hypothetical protein